MSPRGHARRHGLILICVGYLLGTHALGAQPARHYMGGGVAALRVGRATAPLLGFRFARQAGRFMVPDIAIAGIPPFLVAGDIHFGATLPLGGAGSALVLSGGPSVLLVSLGDDGGSAVGFGVNAGLLVRSESTVAIRLDAGPRFFSDRSYGGGARALWMFGLTILSTGERRCGC